MKHFVYILKCSNNTFYTGMTSDLERRLGEHQSGKSIYTRDRSPVYLVYYETVADKFEARKREVLIKDMSQKKKLALIEKFTSI